MTTKIILPKRAPIPTTLGVDDPVVKKILDAVRETIEVWDAQRGDNLDSVVTQRDLVDIGLTGIESAGSTTVVVATPPASGGDEPDLTPPSAPSNLVASGAMTSIILTWDDPSWALLGYTEIWRASVDDVGQSVRIGTTRAFIYSDPVGSTQQSYYYWIRFVSIWDVIGPYNATNGVFASSTAITGDDFTIDFTPVEIVSSMPTPGHVGRIVFLTVNDGTYLAFNLYRDTGDEWTAIAPEVGPNSVTSEALVDGSVIADALATGVIDGNLVLNPGAEDGTNGWEIVEGSGTFRRTSADSVGGDYCFYLNGAMVGAGCRAFPVIPGATYGVRVKARGTSPSTGGFYVRANQANNYPSNGYITNLNRTGLTDFLANAEIPTAWTDYDYVYTVPAGVYWVSFVIYNWAGGPEDVLFDDVEVRRQIKAMHITAGAITALQIAANTITANEIAANTITSNELSANTITAQQIAASTITGNEIAANTITGGLIQAGVITAQHLVADTITATSGVIADLAVLTAMIANVAVTEAKIANLAVTNAKIGTAAVTTAKIGLAQITNALIQNAAITTAKIQNAAVDTLQIAGNAASNPVLSYGGYLNLGLYAYQWRTVTAATITTHGQPVFIVGQATILANGYTGMQFRLLRGGVQLGVVKSIANYLVNNFIVMSFGETPVQGTHTYSLQVYCEDLGPTLSERILHLEESIR